LQNCLKWNPEDRPTAEQLLGKHFNDITITAETEENANFFGEMTKYLEEQFKKISPKLKKG